MPEHWFLLAGLLLCSAVLLVVAPLPPGRATRQGPLSRVLQAFRGPAPTPPEFVDAAILLDLTAALLRTGSGIEAALHRLAVTVPGAESLAIVHRGLGAGAPWRQATAVVSDDEQLALFCQHLSFAYATGAPSAAMLRAAAEEARRQRRQEARRRAEELSVKMMLPLGLCFLPAFILLGVIPVIIGMLPGSLGSGE